MVSDRHQFARLSFTSELAMDKRQPAGLVSSCVGHVTTSKLYDSLLFSLIIYIYTWQIDTLLEGIAFYDVMGIVSFVFGVCFG